MKGIIYHAFDTTNGLAYVGQTIDTLKRRRSGHLHAKYVCPFVHALKARPEAFVWTVLCDGLQTQQELDDAETYWGEFFGCLYPSGYNLKLGSGRGSVSELTKQRMRKPKSVKHRESMKHPKSAEHRDNMKTAQQALGKERRSDNVRRGWITRRRNVK